MSEVSRAAWHPLSFVQSAIVGQQKEPDAPGGREATCHAFGNVSIRTRCSSVADKITIADENGPTVSP